MKKTLSVLSLSVACAAVAAGPSLELRGLAINGSISTNVERRAFADGEAARYVLPEGPRRIAGEETVWTLPEDATAWYSLEDSCYEGLWIESVVREIPVGAKIGLPITARLKDGTYRFLTEANVVDYTDSSVVCQGGGRFAVRYYADEKGFDQEGVAHTPWRVMGSFKDLNALATSDIVRCLCPEPAPEVAARAASFVKPGRSIWHWLPDGAPKFDRQKDWYDRTKEMGYEYYLVDEGWRGWRAGGRDQWSMLEEVVAYGNSIGVKSFVWVHSKELMNPEARRAYLKRVKALGAVGIKIDFMPPPSYRVMKWYEETSRDTLEIGLMLDYHGAVKPTGRERTWPHEVAREAIRGHEWHITRYDRVLPPAHDTILPFTRLVQGHADYTPVVFNPRELVGYTWAHELAQGVVFSAPFLCFGDYPENYLKSDAADLMRALPAVYDETRVLPGSEIGRCVAVAKRAGADWYVAVENGADPRQLKIALTFLGEGTYDLLAFGDRRGGPIDAWQRETRTVSAKDALAVRMKPLGGYVARLRAKSQTLTGPEASLPARVTPEWYNNARFGIFCHWGPQCAPEAGDWYARHMYYPNSGQGKHHQKTYGNPKEFGFKDVINTWKADKWNPEELCALYKRMGATYIQAMANHHDNFDMWDSTHQPWNSVNMGPKRDILKGWSDAARKTGLRFGISMHAAHAWSWYEPARDFDGLLTKADGKGKWWEGFDPQQLYWQNHEPASNYRDQRAIHGQWDWGRGAKVPSEAFRENIRLRTMEALTKYKADLLYYDDTVVSFWPVADEGMRITADFYAMNPDAVVLGKCLNEAQRQWLTWDVERGTPPKPMYPKWQTDTCIGDWHYNRDRERRGYRPARDVLRTLVDVVSKNGNLCLSVPIRSDGTIDGKERAVCEDIAAWMAVNRKAIFDSDPHEICGEGPQLAKAPPLQAQGFNEGRIPRPTKDDVRYLKARDGKGVYAIELAPDGAAPKCPALEAKGMKLVKSFERVKDFPAVHLFE